MQIYERIKYLLRECCPNVYHFEASQEKGDFIVWREISARDLHADDTAAETALRIAVDFFTKDEYSRIPDYIKSSMNRIGAVRGPDVIYNHEIQRTQYAFTVEVI